MLKRVFLGLFLALFLYGCDECRDVNCGNNGICDNGNCNCDDGYEGDECENEIRTKFIGVWTGPSFCDGDEGQATIDILAGVGILEIFLINAETPALSVPAVISGDNFTIQPVTLDLEGYPVTCFGDGSLDDSGEMSFNFNASIDGTEIADCSYTLTK